GARTRRHRGCGRAEAEEEDAARLARRSGAEEDRGDHLALRSRERRRRGRADRAAGREDPRSRARARRGNRRRADSGGAGGRAGWGVEAEEEGGPGNARGTEPEAEDDGHAHRSRRGRRRRTDRTRIRPRQRRGLGVRPNVRVGGRRSFRVTAAIAFGLALLLVSAAGAGTRFDSAALDSKLRAEPGVLSVLVERNGRLVFERYYRGAARSARLDVFSVTKSVTSTLVGIALAEGKLHSLDQRLSDFFPKDVQSARDKRVREITLR